LVFDLLLRFISALMTRPLFLILSIVFVAALVLAHAQVPAASAKTSSISGTVVKEPGSEPLKKVLVQIIAEDQRQGENYSASTDGDGHFQVVNVAAGRYRIFLERSGFIGVNERGVKSDTNILTIKPGQSVDGILFRMLATAVIRGRVTDEDGEPMVGVNVLAQKKRTVGQTRENVAAATTNDLGEFRIPGLFAGQYWVVAMPPPDFRDYQRQEEKSVAAGEGGAPFDNRYVTTYYPETNDASQASAVSVKAGDEIPVEFTLLPTRTYSVRGTLSGVLANQKPVVELLSKTGDSIRAMYELRADEIGSDGHFEIRGVASGSYVVKLAAGAGSTSLRAQQDVTVAAADVDGVKLAPLPSFSVSGHLRAETNKQIDLTQYAVNLRPAESPAEPDVSNSQEFFGTNASVDRLGNFSWKDVNTGNYRVQVVGGEPQSFFLKSVTVGGKDITTGFTANGSTALDVVISAKGGSIEGTVVEKNDNDDAAHPVANATVVAVPEEKYRALADRFVTGSTDQYGQFTIRGLAPGNYTLYAWRDLEDDVWRDASFLKSQEANGKTVKVEEESRQSVTLKLSPATVE
jgi:hypothetical protein